MLFIAFIVFILALVALFSLILPEDKAKKLWMLPSLWKFLGKPIRNVKPKASTYNRVILAYISVIATLNSCPIFFNTFTAFCNGKPIFEISIDGPDWKVLAIDAMLTIIIIIYIFNYRKQVQTSANAYEILSKRSLNIDEIQQLLPVYKNGINKLHLKDALKALEQIRKIVEQRNPVNNLLLASVDYLMGQCLQYIESNSCLSRYQQAYNEMLKSHQFVIKIAEEYAYVMLESDNQNQCKNIYNKILERDPNNIIANVCRLISSNNIVETYKKLPNELKEDHLFIAYAYPYYAKGERDDIFNIEKFHYTILPSLDYNNIKLWVLYISVSTTKLIRHEGYFFFGGQHNSKYMKEVFLVTDNFLKLAADTDVKDIFPDIKVFHTYTNFFLNYNTIDKEKAICEMDKYTPTLANKQTYILMLFEMFMFLDKEQEAHELLDKNRTCKSEIIFFLWIILAWKFSNKDYAEEGFKLITDNNTPIPESQSVFTINTVILFRNEIKEYLPKIHFEDYSIQDVYKVIINYYMNKEYNLEQLLQLGSTCAKNVRFYIAEILSKIDKVDEAIGIIKPLTSTDKFSNELSCYIQLLRKKGDDLNLYQTLKELRHHGFDKSAEYLNLEFQLATKCNDMQDAYEVISILHQNFPENILILYNYAAILKEKKQYDNFDKLIPQIISYTKIEDPTLVINFANLLLAADKVEEALNFLYNNIKMNPSQSLKDFLIACTTSPVASQYIYKSKEVVEECDYIFYKEQGTTKQDVVFKNSLIESFIGCKKGDKVNINRFGVITKAEILDIKNKYFALVQDVYHDIKLHGNSKSIRMFNINDLKDGGGNVLDKLLLLSGVKDNKKAIDDWEKRYAQGNASFILGISISKVFSRCFNSLFGKGIIYSVPYQIFKNVTIDKYNFVLDITSLLLLSSLTKKFNLTFHKKFLIPMGLQLFIQHSIDHEVLNTSSFIDNEAFLSFGLSPKDKELPAVAILKYVQNWIQKYCETKVAENFLLLHFAIKDEFYKVEVESMLLTMNNPVIMISEDWGLINKEKNFKIMNIESFLKLTQPKNIKQISEWLGNMHFAGVDVNENYMYEQYMKERKNQIHSALV